jgi:uncharacterized RDD family membrane protein YckC
MSEGRDEATEAAKRVGPRPPVVEASFLWRRFAAYLLDLSLLVPIFVLAATRTWMLLHISPDEIQSLRGDVIEILLVTWLALLAVTTYNRWWRQGVTGQSWGKRIMGLRLVRAIGGQPIGPRAAFLRDVFNGFIAVGPVLALIHPLGQTLGDIAVGAIVCEGRAPQHGRNGL